MSDYKLTEAELTAFAPIVEANAVAKRWVADFGNAMARVQGADPAPVGERTYAWCPLYMDMDYMQAWLLHVRFNDGRDSIDGPCVVDHLAILHHPGGEVVQWRGQPHHIFDDDFYGSAVEHWFIDWVRTAIADQH